MTIELSSEVEIQLTEAALAQGVTVGEYLETLIEETNLRRRQIAEFKTVIAGRIASLHADGGVDGEQVMARLIADLPSR